MKKVAEQIITEFSFLNSWEEKYEHLIALGVEMCSLKNNEKIDANLIRGCQSKVWLMCEYNVGKLYFYADSDALITKGIVALIVRLYSNSTPKEIIDEKIDVFSTIGLHEHLSMNRANGLSLMLQTIQKYALKYVENE